MTLNPERFRLFILFPIPLLVDNKFKETVYENSTQYNFSLFPYLVNCKPLLTVKMLIVKEVRDRNRKRKQ